MCFQWALKSVRWWAPTDRIWQSVPSTRTGHGKSTIAQCGMSRSRHGQVCRGGRAKATSWLDIGSGCWTVHQRHGKYFILSPWRTGNISKPAISTSTQDAGWSSCFVSVCNAIDGCSEEWNIDIGTRHMRTDFDLILCPSPVWLWYRNIRGLLLLLLKMYLFKWHCHAERCRGTLHSQ